MSKNTSINYEVLGEDNKEMIVLISGLNTRRVHWGLPFCENLSHLGYRILRWDNREGVKSGWHGCKEKHPTINSLAVFLQDPTEGNVSYTLWDMKDDLRRFVSELGFKKVKDKGRSIGGVIGQLLTFRYPSSVKTLTLRLPTSVHSALPKPGPNLIGMLTRIPKTYLNGKEASIHEKSRFTECLSGPNYTADLQKQRDFIIEEINRKGGQVKPFRQTIALASFVYNTPVIATRQTSNLRTHEPKETFFYPKSAKDLEGALPNSRIIMLEQKGHWVPKALFATIAEDMQRFFTDYVQSTECQ